MDKTIESYNKVVKNLEDRGHFPSRIPSLEPTLTGLLLMGLNTKDPIVQKKLFEKVIVVAGTNGKGSVCSTVERILVDQGKKVGLFTSPHLINYTERFRVCGEDISKDKFVTAFYKVMDKLGSHSVSHFEILTLIAVELFILSENFDYCIFEVGLGGKWDATNAIPHRYCVLTHIGYDHQAFLGNSLNEILQNKLGIVKEAPFIPEDGFVIVYSPISQDIENEFKIFSETENVKTSPCIDFEVTKSKGEIPNYVFAHGSLKSDLSLKGRRGGENAAVALTLASELGFKIKDTISSLSRVRWAGRMEDLFAKVSPEKEIHLVLSGDHNISGIDSLFEILDDYTYEKLYILLGIGTTKPADEIVDKFLNRSIYKIILTTPSFRGRPVTEYKMYSNEKLSKESTPLKGLKKVLQMASSKDLVLVTGSLYLVGEVRGILLKEYDVRGEFI